MTTAKPITPLLGALVRPSRLSASQYICAPCLRQRQQQHRQIHKTTKKHPVPEPTPFVPDVQTFLTLIGRGLSAQASKFQSWEKLFTLSSPELKELGIEPARTRRYLLRWIQKFRNGKYGVGGDFKYVKDGTAELRVIELPALQRDSATASTETPFVSATQTPGKTKLILNVPEGVTKAQEILKSGQTTKDLTKPKDFTLKNGHVISGPYALPVAGSHGSTVRVKVQEGMWEDRLGQKVFGGERRRAQVLHKLGVAEHRKAVGTAR